MTFPLVYGPREALKTLVAWTRKANLTPKAESKGEYEGISGTIGLAHYGLIQSHFAVGCEAFFG